MLANQRAHSLSILPNLPITTRSHNLRRSHLEELVGNRRRVQLWLRSKSAVVVKVGSSSPRLASDPRPRRASAESSKNVKRVKHHLLQLKLTKPHNPSLYSEFNLPRWLKHYSHCTSTPFRLPLAHPSYRLRCTMSRVAPEL